MTETCTAGNDRVDFDGRFRLGLSFLCLGVLFTVGCGSKSLPSGQDDPTQQNLETIGRAYARAAMRLNRPPKNLKELMPTLKEQSSQFNEVLRSPNDGEEFVIVWGVEVRGIPGEGDALPVVAYEKSGKGGRRYVLRGGEVVILPESKLKTAVLPPGHVIQ